MNGSWLNQWTPTNVDITCPEMQMIRLGKYTSCFWRNPAEKHCDWSGTQELQSFSWKTFFISQKLKKKKNSKNYFLRHIRFWTFCIWVVPSLCKVHLSLYLLIASVFVFFPNCNAESPLPGRSSYFSNRSAVLINDHPAMMILTTFDATLEPTVRNYFLAYFRIF